MNPSLEKIATDILYELWFSVAETIFKRVCLHKATFDRITQDRNMYNKQRGDKPKASLSDVIDGLYTKNGLLNSN
jgi:hypothetical protein